MKKDRSRREIHSNTNSVKKVMKKLRGKGWVAVTLGLTLGMVGTNVEEIQATGNQAVQAVLRNVKGSSFEEKEQLLSQELISEEVIKAIDGISSTWEANSLAQVKEEIERQKDLDLEAYVVQWGDTLSVIAEAIDMSVEDLARDNGIEDIDLIYAGDLLKLRDFTISESSPIVQTPTKPTPEVGIPATLESPEENDDSENDNSENENDDNEPDVPGNPVPEEPEVEVPSTPEVPETPAPETPETPAPETPETPQPETPETPGDKDEDEDDKEVNEPTVPGDNDNEGNDPELPGDKDEDPELPGDGDEEPELPGDKDEDPELPGDEDEDPELPGDKDEESELPGDGDEDPELPGDGDQEPELPGDGDQEPGEPGEPGGGEDLEPTPEPEEPEQPGPEDPIEPEEPVEGDSNEEIIEEEVISDGRTGEEVVENSVETVISENTTESEVEHVETIPGEDTIEYVERIIEVPLLDDNGDPVLDELGQPIMEEEVITEEVVVPGEPIEVVSVERTVTTTKEVSISPYVIYVYDNTVDTGVKNVLQEGANGGYTVVTTTVFLDGVVTSENSETIGQTEAVDRIVQVGTKEVTGTRRVVQETKELVSGTEVIYDDTMYVDEQVVEQEGVNGSIVVTYEVMLDANGNEVSRTQLDSVITEAQDRIVRRGTKETLVVVLETLETEIPHGSKEIYITLAPGEAAYEVVIQEGVTAIRTLDEYVTYDRGVEVKREVVRDAITRQSVDRVVEIGKPAEEYSRETYEDIEVEFKTEERENSDLPVGETRVVQEGKNGLNRVTTTRYYYKDAYGDEVFLSEEVSNPVVVSTPVNKIIEVGTKVVEETPPTSDANFDATFGKELGDPNYEGNPIIEFNIGEERSYDELKDLSDAVKYQRAKDSQYENNNVGYDDTDKVYFRTPVLPTEEFTQVWNETNEYFDHNLFATEMLGMVNNLRGQYGVGALTLDNTLVNYSDIRAEEQSEYGSLRSNGQAHVRPDGTPWHTVGPEAHGENTAENYVDGNPYQLVSEKYMAETFFNMWKGSQGHLENMVRDSYTRFGVGVGLNEGHGVNKEPLAWAQVIGVQLFGR